MKYSQLFSQTSKNISEQEKSLNAQLLTRAGFVDQLMAGVYSYLPLGLITLRKIEGVVRKHMNELGSQEVLMPTLHPSSIWKTTGGWDSIDVLFKINSRTGNEYALGQSEEEVVAPLVLSRAQSYRNLPLSVYQIGWKYRDELRAKSGIMRGREFLMKDMYSFHTSQEDFEAYYKKAKDVYIEVFKELGLEAKVTEASGGNFTDKVSYEFEVLTDAGEDVIYYCDKCDFCVEDEIAEVKPSDSCPRCNKGTLSEAKAAEVGNVFDLGQKFSKAFDLAYTDNEGKRNHAIMGCYGIGVSRVMGVIAEKHHDDKGLVWPESVAPFKYHIVALPDEANIEAGAKIYNQLGANNCLFDDRSEVSPGAKFADADLIGCPVQIVISRKTLEHDSVEVVSRSGAFETFMLPIAEVKDIESRLSA
jgi:prolyl-tRNA synthetase